MIRAGRELDALVAEKVMGWGPVSSRFMDCDEGGKYERVQALSPRGVLDDVPEFSTDIAAAWEVIEYMLARNFDVQVRGMSRFDIESHQWVRRWDVLISGPECGDGAHFHAINSESVPFCVCLAALKAVGG